MIATILIPRMRVPVILGTNGATKHDIEEKTNTKIFIGEEITIEGEALDVMAAENIIKAIGRGFAPAAALALLDEEKVLYVIQLPKNENELTRIKSRIIGSDGRARQNLERLTNTQISVYGKTVSIIGCYEDADIAKEAIEKLISGSMHSNVYRFLELRKGKGGKHD